MSETSAIVAETAARIFEDLADPQTVNQAKDESWQAPLWSSLEESGLTLAWVPDTLGGAGASLSDGFEVVKVAGRFAATVPLAETLLAGWLLSEAGLSSPTGAMTVAPSRWSDELKIDAAGVLTGKARNVPFGKSAEHIAVLADGPSGPVVALVKLSDVRPSDGHNLAGDSSVEIAFDKIKAVAHAAAPAGLDRQRFMLLGATVRANQMAGALETVLAITTRYAGERVAFEKTISKFQAVQHNLARLAGETAAAVAAAGSAADTFANGILDDRFFLEAAGAKVRVSEAATEGASIGHQVHGAIGFTKEHILHRFTLRLWSWRDDFGNESDWAVRLGRMIAAKGADELWPLVASR
ncbi:acyl-CoA dehydrogenase family protein [Hyphomicrobium sp. CS1BSMeth3]|uniref:acyl-CoA dehydrogenase family protein n=1 Tax=Hyphomicrobium sp. CS1BSMeth3 TaxID=1892844 RepID=UPI00093058C2|nr:acyl-CoA dehydrogenase family protein [Hyphomicrobium sp. CS1BSMeth3]